MGFRDDIEFVVGALQHGMPFETAYGLVQQAEQERDQHRMAQQLLMADVAGRAMQENVDPAMLPAYAAMMGPSMGVGPRGIRQVAEAAQVGFGGSSWTPDDESGFFDLENANSAFNQMKALGATEAFKGADGLPDRAKLRDYLRTRFPLQPGEDASGFNSAVDRAYDQLVRQQYASDPSTLETYDQKLAQGQQQQMVQQLAQQQGLTPQQVQSQLQPGQQPMAGRTIRWEEPGWGDDVSNAFARGIGGAAKFFGIVPDETQTGTTEIDVPEWIGPQGSRKLTSLSSLVRDADTDARTREMAEIAMRRIVGDADLEGARELSENQGFGFDDVVQRFGLGDPALRNEIRQGTKGMDAVLRPGPVSAAGQVGTALATNYALGKVGGKLLMGTKPFRMLGGRSFPGVLPMAGRGVSRFVPWAMPKTTSRLTGLASRAGERFAPRMGSIVDDGLGIDTQGLLPSTPSWTPPTFAPQPPPSLSGIGQSIMSSRPSPTLNLIERLRLERLMKQSPG